MWKSIKNFFEEGNKSFYENAVTSECVNRPTISNKEQSREDSKVFLKDDQQWKP